MDSWKSTRSVPVAVSVIVALAIGVICFYALPVLTTSGDEFFDEPGESLKYGDIRDFMDAAGGGWANSLAWAGLALAIVAAVALPRSLRQLQALLITAGAIAAMAVPFWLSRNLEADSLGSGAILACIAFAIAAVLPWIWMKSDRDTAMDNRSVQSSPEWMRGQ